MANSSYLVITEIGWHYYGNYQNIISYNIIHRPTDYIGLRQQQDIAIDTLILHVV